MKGGDILQRNIKVLVVEPYSEPRVEIIHNRLSDKQHLVGGLIEYTYMEDDENVAILCNEEGKYLGLPLNRDIGHDIIAGTFVIVGDNDTGEDRSLTDEQIDKYTKKFGKESIIETQLKVNNILNNVKDDYEL